MDPAKLKVVELRAQLSQRGLDTKGNKPILVERLRKALEDESDGQPQDKVDRDSEDSPIQDVVQPPRTPGRSSRSSSVTTPTKVGTRSTPRTPRGSTPTKAQYRDKSPENLPTEESTPEKSTIQEQEQEEDISSFKEDENQQEEEMICKKESATSKDNVQECKDEEVTDSSVDIAKSPTKIAESPVKAMISPKKSAESPVKTSESPKMPTDSPNKMESPTKPIESPTQIVDSPKKPVESPEKPKESPKTPVKSPEKVSKEDVEERKKEESKEVTETHRSEAATVEESKECIQNSEENTELALDNSNTNDEAETSCKDDKNAEANENDQSVEEDVDMESNTEKCDVNETKSTNIPLNDQSACIDEEMEDNDARGKENTSNVAEKQDATDSDKIDEDDLLNDDQDTEMTEIKDIKMEEIKDTAITEVKSEEKPKVKELEKKDRHDRKRKRSPSPLEERKMSPLPAKHDDEPEIDNSSVVLSWYDSDLNLDINKNGFFSATPMHTDGFCYIWAGSRASYGFTCGKVYYEAKITEHCSINAQDVQQPHILRLGWSVPEASMQLGEEKHSYAYDSTGKKATDNEFTDYGPQFNKDDVIGCYLDSCTDNVILSYTLNGEDLGTAFSISKEELGNRPLFPHILSRNCSFACNFGQEEKSWSENIPEGYVFVGKVDLSNRISGPQRPEKKEDCEVIMMCGLPAAGKTFWATKHAGECPEKKYNILGLNSLVNKMTEMGKPCKESFQGRWDALIDKCARSLNKLIEIASCRRRNYILDQTNIYSSAQRRKMRGFSGYQRKAVVVVPTEEEYKSRISKHENIEGKKVSDSTLTDMKANFTVPVVGDNFDSVEWVELGKEEGIKLIERYNKEGKEAGYNQHQQQPSKRPRFEKSENRDSRDTRNNRDHRDNRDSRDSRDHRDRKMSYSDKNRNPSWRGGWRDRGLQRGGHMRHGSGYGPPAVWRGRGGSASSHRGTDRRGSSGDRRSNDRNRSRGGWGPMSSYQGQQSNWNQNWSGSQSQPNWNQGGGGWGGGQQQQQQQWSSGGSGSSGGGGGGWKSYGQSSSYSQPSNYNQGYGNGNWNSWNQQYYSNQQYWGQQHQSGQTTASSGQSMSKQ